AASSRPLVSAATALLGVFAIVLMAGALGSGLALLLVSAVSPRRARLLAAFLSAAGLGAALVGFRVARPERILDPVSALLVLERIGQTPPAAPGLNPAAWAAHAATGALFGDVSAMIPAALLLGFSALAPVAATRLFWRLHLALYQKTRESEGRVESRGLPGRAARSLNGELLRAEARSLLRDASTPAQLGSLAAVFVLDLLNVQLLPSTDPASRDVVAGLQAALALFLVAALSLRFAYPAVSADARSALVLRTLPLSPARHLVMRYLVRALPSLAMTLVLVGLSDAVLKPGRGAVIASLVVATIGALSLPALNLGLGALFPRYDAPNAVAVALGPGGLVALTLSTALALVAGLAVSDELRVLFGSLLEVRLSAPLLVGGWCVAALALGIVPTVLGARALIAVDRAAG
ncbi:MAG TPA: hypothetical protein VGR00_08655, partial [Thermoanaerobaculia bacterium]|nr:hypothetical protein [Thermoanaerobaculia bacterium]